MLLDEVLYIYFLVCGTFWLEWGQLNPNHSLDTLWLYAIYSAKWGVLERIFLLIFLETSI